MISFRVTTFVQFYSIKAVLNILLHCVHNFNENLKTLYSKLVTNNDFEHKSYDARQHVLSYSGLLKLCSDKLLNCKFQIMHLTSQVDNIFATLDQPNLKCTKRGLIPSLFNFLFRISNCAEEIHAIQNNMAIFKKSRYLR